MHSRHMLLVPLDGAQRHAAALEAGPESRVETAARGMAALVAASKLDQFEELRLAAAQMSAHLVSRESLLERFHSRPGKTPMASLPVSLSGLGKKTPEVGFSESSRP